MKMELLNESSERIRKGDQEEIQDYQRSISSIRNPKYSEKSSDLTKLQSSRL